MKILVVDDSRTVHSFIKIILQSGFVDVQISSVFNGEEALQKLNELGKNFFDVILIDWEMPIMDGPTTVQQFVENGVKTPVIMITSKAMNHHEDKMLKSGVTSFIRKPFHETDLVDYIKSITNQ